MAWIEQRLTEERLNNIQKSILDYQRISNASPENFRQLQFSFQEPSDAEEYFKDYWNHPLVLSKNGTNCFVMSYGADGKPGGTGIDCDLTPMDRLPRNQSLLSNNFGRMDGPTI